MKIVEIIEKLLRIVGAKNAALESIWPEDLFADLRFVVYLGVIENPDAIS